MESTTERQETLNFLIDLSHSVFAKENKELDPGEGSLTACPRMPVCEKEASSEISSMKANADTVAVHDSSSMLKVESILIPKSTQNYRYKAPWRIDAVNLADLEHLKL